MTKLTNWLVGSIVMITFLIAAGPTLVALAHALVPLVIAVGIVAAALRLVYYLTRTW
jgi:hypothetical protein